MILTPPTAPQPTTRDKLNSPRAPSRPTRPNRQPANPPTRPTSQPATSMAAILNPPRDQHHARLLPSQSSPSRLPTTRPACPLPPADLIPPASHAHRRSCRWTLSLRERKRFGRLAPQTCMLGIAMRAVLPARRPVPTAPALRAYEDVEPVGYCSTGRARRLAGLDGRLRGAPLWSGTRAGRKHCGRAALHCAALRCAVRRVSVAETVRQTAELGPLGIPSSRSRVWRVLGASSRWGECAGGCRLSRRGLQYAAARRGRDRREMRET